VRFLTDEPAGNGSEEEPKFEETGKIDMETVVKPEDRFKLSLLSMDKRFMDLEFAISEIAARVKDIDPENLKTLDQRIESMEDMVMVEQAAVLELKRVMEGVDQGFRDVASLRDVEDMRERVRRVENLARAAAEMTDLPAELSQETRQRLKSLEDGVSELKEKVVEVVSPMEVAEMRRGLGNLGERMSIMRMAVDDLKRNIDKRVQEGIKGAQITTADFGFIDSKVNSLKTAIDILSDKRVENEMKIAAMEQRLANVHAGEAGDSPLSEKVIDELRNMKRELEGAKLRMDSVERVVQETARTAHDAEAAARRFEGFERLSGLQREIDDKLRQFNFVKDEMGRLSNRVEMMYENMDKRFAELHGAEREMQDVKRTMADARKEIEMTKFGLKRAASKDELAGVAAEVGGARRLEGRVEELGEAVRKLDAAQERGTQGGVSAEVLVIMKELADRLENAERTVIDMQKGAEAAPSVPGQLGMQDFEGRMNDVIDKLVFLESRLTALEAIFQTSSRTQAVVIE
jgi:chromosome segregation ATPase